MAVCTIACVYLARYILNYVSGQECFGFVLSMYHGQDPDFCQVSPSCPLGLSRTDDAGVNVIIYELMAGLIDEQQ